MMRVHAMRRGAGAVALAAALAGGVAHAALFDDEEARKRVAETNVRLTQVQKQLEDRIGALEQQLKSQGLVEMFGAVEQLKADLARMRGQIEVLAHELAEAQKRQRDLYVDLDSRMRRLETANAPAAGVPAAPGAAGAPVQAVTATPPLLVAIVKLPPAYRSLPDTASAYTHPFTPKPSALQLLPFHLATNLTALPPSVDK